VSDRVSDPLGSLFFAVGIHDILVSTAAGNPLVTILAYHDDIHLTGPAPAIQASCFAITED
jgi:hypothetical protein